MSEVNGVRVEGAAETMLQTLYARAKESQKPDHKIYDAKAVEIVQKLDYDFSLADKDTAMSSGVVARTIVLDGMVRDYVKKYPDATVVNIACGLDTRFYRVDNGRIRWYNVDLPATMKIREQFIQERYIWEPGQESGSVQKNGSGSSQESEQEPGQENGKESGNSQAQEQEPSRVINLAASAMDARWAAAIPAPFTGDGKFIDDFPVLIIIEGLSMYLSTSDIEQILDIIDRHFQHATVFMEILNPKFVHKNIEKSIQQKGAVFTWGAASGEELVRLCPAFQWKGDRSLVEGMEEIMPIYKIIGKIAPVRNLSNKIAVLQK